MTQHTPGPWGLSDNSAAGFTGNDGSLTVVSNVFAICDVRLTKHYPRGKTYKAADEQRDANARLIMAAPELLAAVLAAGSALAEINQRNEQQVAALAKIAAAIAKATGPL